MKTTGRKTVKAAGTSAPKAKRVNTGSTTAVAAAAEPTRALHHDDIAKRAYELFLARGGADGHDAEDWVRAETELLGR